METKNIEVLLRAIELGSLSKAAEEYLYTPSAVSHILQSIENEIGVKLVRRTYKGIEAEKDSEDIIENLRQLICLNKQIMKTASDKKHRKNAITIGTYASVSKYLLPGIIKEFKRKFPDTDINIIVDDNMKDIYNNNNTDILFGEKIETKDLVWEKLLTDPYVAVLPKSYNVPENVVSREELYKKTFIMAIDSKISEYLRKDRIHDIIKVNSQDDSSIIQMVKEGMGVAVLPALSIGESQSVICRELNPPLSRNLGIMYHKNDFQKKAYMRNFIAYIKSVDIERMIRSAV